MTLKSKQKTIRISLEHPIQSRILELAESGKPVKLKDGRFVMATDFLRELLIIGYQQVDGTGTTSLQSQPINKNVSTKIQKNDHLDSMTEPI